MGPQSRGTLPGIVDGLGFGMTDLSPLSVLSVSKRPRVAVLVDGENIRAEHAGKIISKSLAFGDLMVRRVYGNMGNLKKWQDAPGFRLIHSGSGKNATDILLAVEAMSLVLTKQVDAVVIVSSDRDFTHLATNLRESGHLVVGMGESKASEAFRKACVRFEILPEMAVVDAVPKAIAVPPKALPQRSELDCHIRDLIHSVGIGGSIGIAKLGSLMRQKHNKVSADYGSATWSSYLRKCPDIYDFAANAGNPSVRLKHPYPQPHSVP